MKFFDFDGLGKDVLIFLGGEILQDFVVKLIFHDFIFVLYFHGKFMLFKLCVFVCFFLKELTLIDLIPARSFELLLVGWV